ncbi:hypothetical protein [Mycobacterium sp.]|nr:hypothetical protein [Mycobacterium sp.]HME47625.1 hypothetical protein [Mycobacterium sp.]
MSAPERLAGLMSAPERLEGLMSAPRLARFMRDAIAVAYSAA